jgi:hypothetical protein
LPCFQFYYNNLENVAIFPRRVVQQTLIQSGQFLSKLQVEACVHKLNEHDPQTQLSAEWELLTLAAFQRLGTVRHEESVGGSSRLDLIFSSNSSSTPQFVADIRTVSDEGLHRENPVSELQRELYRQLRKRGIHKGGFHIEISSRGRIPQPDRKLLLALPSRGQIGSFLKSELGNFLGYITRCPEQPHEITVDRPDVALKIRFDPSAIITFTLHPAYTAAYHKEQNPVFRALEDKAKQLKNSGYDGARGIILCDGGCATLYPSKHVGFHYSLAELVNRFFRVHRSVSFVLAISVFEQTPHGAQNAPVREISGNLFLNPEARTPVSREVEAMLRSVHQQFPTPRLTATTAVGWLGKINRHCGMRFTGGFSLHGSTIKIPASSLIALLAGVPPPKLPINKEPTIGEFHPQVTKFFERHFKEGSAIKSIRFDPEPSLDDDWVVITFGAPDPASNPYSSTP